MSISLTPDSLRVLRHLDKMDEIDSIILKANILIEQQLNQIVEDFLIHSKYIRDENISISIIRKFARSASLSESNNLTWTIIEKIYSLRNKIAHNVQPPKKTIAIKNIREIYNKGLRAFKMDKNLV